MTDHLTPVFLGGAAAIVVSALVILYRAIVGPTIHDRLISVSALGTSITGVLVLLAAGLGRPEYLDIALVYALLNFLLSVFVARFTYDPEGVSWQ